MEVLLNSEGRAEQPAASSEAGKQPPHAAPRSAAPRAWVLGFLLFVLTLVVYAPALGAPLIWDDHILISRSPRVTSLQPLHSYFDQAFWQRDDASPGGQVYYRPIAVLSLALDHALHGSNSGGYHLTNIVLHAVSALLLFGVLRQRVAALPAFGIALGWAWFPRLSEAAAWISGRTDVLASLFVFAALWTSKSPSTRSSRAVAAGLVFLGLLSKEVALAGLLGLGVKEWLEGQTESLRRRAQRLLPLALAAAGYFALRSSAIGVALEPNNLTYRERFWACLEACGRYTSMLLDAWHPAIKLGDLDAVDYRFAALGAVVLMGVVALVFRLRKQLGTAEFAGLTLLAVSWGLVLHVVPITVSVVAADRFMYLPLAALLLLLAPVIARAKRSVVIALAVLVASFAPATWARAAVWSDEVDFWAAAFRDQKTMNAMSRLELGNVYARAGLYHRAILLYLDAEAQGSFDYLMTRHNIASNLMMLGHYPDAIATLEGLTKTMPDVPKFETSLASAYIAGGQLELAKRHVQRALELHPSSAVAQRLSTQLTELQQQEDAPAPDSTPNRLRLAHRAVLQSRPVEALEHILAAAAAPDCPRADLEAGILYAFDSGTFKQLTELVQRYRSLPNPEPGILENYEIRQERVAQLQQLWPTLSPFRTHYPSNEVFTRRPAPAATP